MQNQAFVFLIFILNGFLIGILFDIFRILRKSFKTPDILTYLQDIAFWLLVGLMLLYSIFKFNNGELRLYIFIGVLLGNFLYMLLFSKLFINISVTIIEIIKKTIYILIFIPIKNIFMFLQKIFYNPFRIIVTKFTKIYRKIIKFLQIKSKNIKIKSRIEKNKKDFA